MLMEEGVPLDLAHEAEIEARLAALRGGLGRACLSDFAFSNLYLFRAAHAYRYLPGAMPCVAGISYDGVRHLLPLFDLAHVAVADLHDLLDGYDCFFPVSGDAAARFPADRFSLSASVDDADYLYPADNFRHYRGDVLRKKRQLMQQLLDAARVEVHPLNPRRMEDALQVHARWLRDKDKTAGDADDAACREALRMSAHFRFDSMVFYANGEPAGFLMTQRITPQLAVMRFAKGIDAWKGIYQYMFHWYCVQRPELQWINFEQDMGLANFRQTKRSYLPCAMVEKVRVKPL